MNYDVRRRLGLVSTLPWERRFRLDLGRAGVPELVKRVGGFVKSLVAAVKGL
jgi:hypothetical protein